MTLLPRTEATLRAAIRAHQDSRQPRRARRCLGGLVPPSTVLIAVGAGVALLVAIGALALGGHSVTRSSGGSRVPVPTGARQLAAVLGVLRRPQTAVDRSLLARVRDAQQRYAAYVRLFSRGPAGGERLPALLHGLAGIVPSLTRHVTEIPGGGSVFLVVYPQSIQAGGDTAELVFVFTNPTADRRPVVGADGQRGLTAPQIQQLPLNQFSCFGVGTRRTVDHAIVPDGIARMRWIFNRQDALGFVYPHPLTLRVPVHSNAVVELVTNRAACASPDSVTLYAPNGHPSKTYGDPAVANRITKPVRHGTPWGP